jgi:hypothetical protein
VCFLWRLLGAPLNSAAALSKRLLRLQSTLPCVLQARNDVFCGGVCGFFLFVLCSVVICIANCPLPTAH